MTRLQRITGKQLMNILLSKHGFELVRVKGSHHLLKHSDGRSTVVPIHAGDTIGPGLMRKILRDCEITKEELLIL